MPELNENCPAFHCGRLMAILAGLQYRALGPVKAGVIQQFYGAMSTVPVQVFGRLMRLSQAHLRKLAREKPGLSHWYRSKIAEIVHDDIKVVPHTFGQEEQSLFALGYCKEIAERAAKKEKEGEVQDEEQV